MVNTQILAHSFDFQQPRTLKTALHLLQNYRSQAKVLAGGTDLLVQMKLDKIHPQCLIHIGRIPGLRRLREEDGLSIGALISFRDLEKSALVRKKYTALFEAARAVSSVQIKNMGTVGGNLCHASPASDSAPALIALGATVKLAGEGEERTIPLEEFFTGPGETILAAHELLVEIRLAPAPLQRGSAFLKIGRVAADLAKINVAVSLEREGEGCRECRIVLGAVAPVPLRARKAEEILRGRPFSDSVVESACRQAAAEIQPITDLRSTAWYRGEVSQVLARDALNLAWKRSQ